MISLPTCIRKTITRILLSLTVLNLSAHLVCAKFDESQAVAAVIVREAGGEGRTGMLAVANTIQNRANKVTPFEVVSAPYQFSSVNAVVLTRESSWEEIIAISMEHPRWPLALELSKGISNRNLVDITGGATNFYSGNVKPYWTYKMQPTIHIGGHFFYKKF